MRTYVGRSDKEHYISDDEWYKGILRGFVANRLRDVSFSLHKTFMLSQHTDHNIII